ncbi:MAG: hypothetical protein ACOZQL_35715 [Myxococcota bacterium]
MKTIAVLGGRGFLGSRAVAALRRAGADVAVASRRGAVQVDVARPETWDALAPYEVVVDVTDTVRQPPDALIAWCLARGKTVLEATSEAACIERLHRAHVGSPTGRLVLGGGIFTGVSNLLARDVAQRVGGAEQVTLGISSSPFSGAGRGTIELMVRAMTLPSVRYEHGQRVESFGMRPGPVLDFGGARRATGSMSLAEPPMVHASTGAGDVEVFFAPRPSVLVPLFAALPGWLVRQRWFQGFMRGYFIVLRRALLRWAASPVELVAEARRGEATARRWVHARDGIEAGGVALAAITEAVCGAGSWTGVRFVDDVCELETVVARVNQLAGRALLVPGEA